MNHKYALYAVFVTRDSIVINIVSYAKCINPLLAVDENLISRENRKIHTSYYANYAHFFVRDTKVWKLYRVPFP